MLYEVMLECNNLFAVDSTDGTFEISGGSISLPISAGQYYVISGSVFNDGLHQYGEELRDETFKGTIYFCAVPKAFEDMANEIKEWASKYNDTPYQSESFGGYTYSKVSGKDGAPVTWQDAFRSRLNVWRKV